MYRYIPSKDKSLFVGCIALALALAICAHLKLYVLFHLVLAIYAIWLSAVGDVQAALVRRSTFAVASVLALYLAFYASYLLK